MPKKRRAERPSEADIVRDVATIKELGRREKSSQAPRCREHEGAWAVTRFHDEAKAPERQVIADEIAVGPI